MEQIGSWNEFLECRARLLGHLADVAKKCWHSEYIIGSYCEKYGDTYCRAGGPKSKVFGLKDKRLFYGAVRKVPKETILHLYMAAAKYLPGEVGRYASELGFKDYKSTRVPYRWHRGALAICRYDDNHVEFDFLYLLLGNDKEIYSTIIHELCHTVHHNHKLEFWKLYERKLKEAALVEQDYDGWPSTEWEWKHVTEEYMYLDPLELLPRGCMACEPVEVYLSQYWDEFNKKVKPTLRKIIRKKLQECYEEGLAKEYARLYGVDYMSLF